MNVFSRAWRWLSAADALTFDADTGETPPRPIAQVILEAIGGGELGPKPTRRQALTVPGVLRARNLICSVATLPLAERTKANVEVDNELLNQFDPNVPNVVHMAQTLEDLLFDSVAWWKIIEADALGYPKKVQRKDPDVVTLKPPGDGRSPAPLPSGEDPRGAQVWIDGHPVPASKVIRFDSPNPALLDAARLAIRRSLALDRTAEMYAKNPRPLDFFTPADGVEIDNSTGAVGDLLTDWARARQEGSTAYIPAMLAYNQVDTPTPVDLQLIDQMRRADLVIANATGLDPEDLGVSTTSRTYQNAVDRRRDRINDTFSPYMQAITQRLSMPDITPSGNQVVFDLDEYLRADPKTRWDVYGIGIDKGVIDPEYVRAEEGLPPGAPEPPPAPTVGPPPSSAGGTPIHGATASADPAYRVIDGRLIRVGARFDSDAGLSLVVMPGVLRQFTVDRGSRLVSGIAVPYGPVAHKYGRRWRFIYGCFNIDRSQMSRIKLLRDHDFSQAVGKLVDFKDTAAGLWVQFKIATGADGDGVLALAAEEILDGLSVGTDWDPDSATDVVADPRDPGGFAICRATLREVSLTAMPAFDDARLSSVNATREGTSMLCTRCGQMHAANVTCPVVPNQITAAATPATDPPAAPAAQTLALRLDTLAPGPAPGPALEATFTLAQFQALMAAAPSMGQPSPAAPVAPRPVVDPTQGPAVVTREEPDYRWNGERGKFDFSTDVFAGFKGDQEAGARAATGLQLVYRALHAGAMDYKSGELDLTFDAIATTDVTALNPTRQRPDMYVDQLEYLYPLWDAINSGTLADITPFTFPKFSASSGLVAPHVEGIEPSLGDFTATSQTVTPTAVSGKMEINREVVDQGGNPQTTGLIWRQMVRAYDEALEIFAAAQLNAATLTGFETTVTTGAADDALDDEWTGVMVDLLYTRGGNRFTDMFLQLDLYKAFARAVDGDGRKLYPAIGPMNATGTMAKLYRTLDLNGQIGRPAWALGATSAGSSNSYLFNPDDVHGWATAPRRIDLEVLVKNVYIGIWGYEAFAVSRAAGIRRIKYDPAV